MRPLDTERPYQRHPDQMVRIDPSVHLIGLNGDEEFITSHTQAVQTSFHQIYRVV